MDDISRDEYIECLMDEVGLVKLGYANYTKLFLTLLEINYLPDVDSIDKARATDVYGILRVPYGWGENEKTVSICEVLIAMCVRIATAVMGDENPGKYFWEFVGNLGLLEFDNRHFDVIKIEEIIENWLKKSYQKNGIGSPFPIPNTSFDLRSVDMWRHCNLYLSENYV